MSRGIASGSTWLEIAVTIAKGMNSPFRKAYNNAIRIARTEGHRIQNEAALDAQKEAVKRGAKVKKKDGILHLTEGQGRNIEKQTDRSGNLMNLLTLAVRKCKHRVLVVLQGMCVTVDVVYCNVQNGL